MKNQNKKIIKKISSTKSARKLFTNQNQITCKISRTKIAPNKGISLHILKNNSAYISKDYLKHQIFEGVKISLFGKIDLLTCAYYGATINNCNNKAILKCNNYEVSDIPSYQIILKNGLQISIYDNDAKVKKYFNVLKYMKRAISGIYYIVNKKSYLIEDKNVYPPFAKKIHGYKYFGGYNPKSKNDCIEVW